MIKVWENSKVVLSFEDIENDKLVRQTLSNLEEDAADTDIESVVRAFDALSDFPLAYAVVTQSDRMLI